MSYQANATGTTDSGRFVQSSYGFPGNFELVVFESGDKLAHYYRNNDSSQQPWSRTATISNSASSSGAILQSTFGIISHPGNFEVLVLEGTNIVHYFRDNSNGEWSRTAIVSTKATGAPAFIQSDFVGTPGQPGNFEAVILEGNNLVHYYRDNTTSGFPWHPTVVITNKATGPGSIIQSTYKGSGSSHGNFEVVVPEGNDLVHYWRDNAASGFPWNRTVVISNKVTGPASLIQSSYLSTEPGSQPNFELVAIEGKELVHYWRDNSSAGSEKWNFGATIDGNAKGPGSLIQGNYGRPNNPGNFEVVVVDETNSELVHWWRDNTNGGNRKWTESVVIATNVVG